MNTALNRTTIAYLTNKSGGQLDYGDVVILDNTNANGFTTTTTAALATRGLGVIFDVAGIANNATGAVAVVGWCPQINLDGAATVGQFVYTSTVAGQGTPHASPQVAGDFAVVLEAGTAPPAILFGTPNPTAGSGDVIADAALTSGLVVIGAGTTHVDVLAAGSDGDVLTQAAGVASWAAAGGGGGLVLLEQHTASASASLDFTTCISSTYDDYLIELINIIPVSDGVDLVLRVSTNGGSSYDSGNNYSWQAFRWTNAATAVTGATATSGIRVNGAGASAISNSASWGVRSTLHLSNPLSASAYKVIYGTAFFFETGTNVRVQAEVSGAYESATAVDAFQFLMSSGNIASGTIRVYGLEK